MPAEILSPLVNDPIATLTGDFDMVVWYDLAAKASLQCFVQNGSPDAATWVNGSDVHSGTVTAHLPSGKRDVFIKLDGVEADRERDIEVTIGGGMGPGGGGGGGGGNGAFALMAADEGGAAPMAKARAAAPPADMPGDETIRKVRGQPGKYKISGTTNLAPKTRYVTCVVYKNVLGTPRLPIKIAFTLPDEDGAFELILKIPNNSKKVRHTVRVLFMSKLDEVLRPVTLVVP